MGHGALFQWFQEELGVSGAGVAIAVVKVEAYGALDQGGGLGWPGWRPGVAWVEAWGGLGAQAPPLPASFPLCTLQSSAFPAAGGVLLLQPF